MTEKGNSKFLNVKVKRRKAVGCRSEMQKDSKNGEVHLTERFCLVHGEEVHEKVLSTSSESSTG